jgi:hypothetical protein
MEGSVLGFEQGTTGNTLITWLTEEAIICET